MIDPLTALSVAASAVSNAQQLIAAGRDTTSALAKFAGAVSDVNYAAEKAKNPSIWKSLTGSAEAEAIEIFAAQKKMQQMREEIKEHITWHYGKSAWDEVLQIEASMRRRRKEELYRKQAQVDAVINFAIGAVIFLVSGGLLFLFFYIWGQMQGRW